MWTTPSLLIENFHDVEDVRVLDFGYTVSFFTLPPHGLVIATGVQLIALWSTE